MDEAKPIDLSALHLDSLTAAAGMSRRKQSNPRQIKRKFLSFTRRAAALPGGSEFIPDRRLRCAAGRTGPAGPAPARRLSRCSGLPARAPVFWRRFTVQTRRCCRCKTFTAASKLQEKIQLFYFFLKCFDRISLTVNLRSTLVLKKSQQEQCWKENPFFFIFLFCHL